MKELKLNADGGFKILQLSDLHLNYRYEDAYRLRTLKTAADIIGAEKPDLTVVTGDLAWTPYTERAYAEFRDLMDGFGRPWTIVFGNHDRDFIYHTQVLEQVLAESEFCLYRHGDNRVDGDGNYSLTVDGGDGRPAWALWFFDTGRCSVNYSQISWFMSAEKELESSFGAVPGFVFLHTPFPEYELMTRTGDIEGSNLDKSGVPPTNAGLFSALLEHPIKAVFCGHDHANDYVGQYLGITLACARITGYNNWGRNELGRQLSRGGRIIELQGESFSTCICGSDGLREL